MLGFPKSAVSDIAFLTERLNGAPARKLRTHEWEDGDYWLYSTDRIGKQHGEEYCYQDNRWILLFEGDLISHPDVPWMHILDILNDGSFSQLSELVGIWALAAIDKASGDIYLVSDHLSEHPFFYSLIGNRLGFSTELHMFCRLTERAEFNRSWLHHCLLLQYPLGDNTYIEGVRRLPTGSVLIFRDTGLSIFKYREEFRRAPVLKAGSEALYHAFQVFDSELHNYPANDGDWAMGLTAGFDARTVLAFTIEQNPLTYTYGSPGCSDIRIAREAAKRLGLRHKTIPFDQRFENAFEDLLIDVVYLSGGLENPSRAALLHCYRTITKDGTRFPVIASGIGLDSMFRGHLGPALVSPLLAGHFRGEKEVDISPIVADMVLDKQALNSDSENAIDYLQSRYGPLDQSAAHLLYFIYETAPKYFGGEVSLARNFTTLRIPALNPHIIDLALSIEKGALSFSNFLATHKRDSFVEKELQAFLLSKASGGRMGWLPVYDVPPNIFCYGETAYNFAKMFASFRRLSSRVLMNTKQPAALQQNIRLYRTVAADRVLELLYSETTRIATHVNVPEFDILVTAENQHLFKMLLAAEIIMRLIESRWTRFW